MEAENLQHFWLSNGAELKFNYGESILIMKYLKCKAWTVLLDCVL